MLLKYVFEKIGSLHNEDNYQFSDFFSVQNSVIIEFIRINSKFNFESSQKKNYENPTTTLRIKL